MYVFRVSALVSCTLCFFFFFKQKTAYEVRISDWSSDVCSSDLAAGLVGPGGALIIGIAVGIACLWGVNGLKRLLRADDSLDVFGIHGVGGIVGALLTGVFNAKPLGGPGLETLAEVPYQVWLQLEGVLITIVWSAVVAWVAYFIADKVCGLRVSADVEREGLDISTHGETAYHR